MPQQSLLTYLLVNTELIVNSKNLLNPLETSCNRFLVQEQPHIVSTIVKTLCCCRYYCYRRLHLWHVAAGTCCRRVRCYLTPTSRSAVVSSPRHCYYKRTLPPRQSTSTYAISEHASQHCLSIEGRSPANACIWLRFVSVTLTLT